MSSHNPEALAALSPLLESAACTTDALKNSSTTDELGELARGIITTAGGRALPHSAAVVLLGLLECDGVIQQLPADEVLRAVSSLGEGRRAGRTVPDPLADALVDKLGSCSYKDMSPMSASCLLYSCGASFDYLRRAAESLLQGEGSDSGRGCSLNMWMGVLFGLASCDVTESVSTLDAALRADGRALEREGDSAAPATAMPRGTVRDTPLADVALRAYQEVAAAVQEGRLELQLEEGSDVSLTIAAAVDLEGRLEGLQVRRQDLLASLHVILDHVVDSVEAAAFGERVGADSFNIWRVLDDVLCLGECQVKGGSVEIPQRKYGMLTTRGLRRAVCCGGWDVCP